MIDAVHSAVQQHRGTLQDVTLIANADRLARQELSALDSIEGACEKQGIVYSFDIQPLIPVVFA